jgi:acyl-CoA synthetase (AMP-forming)/AMP-acid ligase II
MTVLLNAALHARPRLVIMPSFDLGEFLRNIQNHRCTIAFIAPPVAVALAKHLLIDEYDLSSLNTVMSGAAPLDADLGHAVAKRLGCRAVQGDGMSEVSPVSHITPFDGGTRQMGIVAPLSSVGWTVSNAACKIVDPETGDEIDVPAEGLSDAGELWFKGPNVMAGYLNNEEGHQGDHRRRGLAAYRQHGPRRRKRLRLHRRRAQGADQVQGLPGAAGRTRSGTTVAPRNRRRRGDRRQTMTKAKRRQRRSWSSNPERS